MLELLQSFPRTLCYPQGIFATSFQTVYIAGLRWFQAIGSNHSSPYWWNKSFPTLESIFGGGPFNLCAEGNLSVPGRRVLLINSHDWHIMRILVARSAKNIRVYFRDSLINEPLLWGPRKCCWPIRLARLCYLAQMSITVTIALIGWLVSKISAKRVHNYNRARIIRDAGGTIKK